MRRRLAVLMLAVAASGCQQAGVPRDDATPGNHEEANISDVDAANQAICNDCPPYDNYDGPPLG